jgi:hypothetical protein
MMNLPVSSSGSIRGLRISTRVMGGVSVRMALISETEQLGRAGEQALEDVIVLGVEKLRGFSHVENRVSYLLRQVSRMHEPA